MKLEDLRHAVRRLRMQPARTLATVGMLAIAVGVTTAVFTVADALVFTPVPFPNADRLTHLVMFGAHGGSATVSPAVLRAWKDAGVFDAVEGVSRSTAILDAKSGPAVERAARVTPGLFVMLGVRPIVGRGFEIAEGRAGTDDRAILSEGLWRSTFGGDRGIIGRTVTIDGVRAVVVGVMPANFRFPEWSTAVWRPIDFSAPPAALTNERPEAFVRFSATIPPADALRRATDAARAAGNQTAADMRATALPLAGAFASDYWRIVPALFGGVGLVFLVLCANVCSLLLATMAARRREIQVRAALGASRRRLFTQIAVEHAVLGLAGGVAGVAAAWMLVALSRGFLPEAFLLRTLHPVDLDMRALAVAVLTGVGATVAAGLVPAWLGTRADASLAIDNGRAATPSRIARLVTNGLLVSEIAVACALLVGAALSLRSFAMLSAADRGLHADGVLTAWLSLPARTYPDRASRVAAQDALEGAVRTLPGVREVAMSFGIPPAGGSTHFYENWMGDDLAARPQTLEVESYMVGPEFFDLYGIPMLQGRPFAATDADDSAIVGERLAALLWPGHSPVGHRFSFGTQQYEVIGVAREINFPSLDAQRDLPEFYERFKGGRSYVSVSMRCVPQCPGEAEIRLAIARATPHAVVTQVGAAATAYLEELARPRASAALATVFGVIAMLAVAGGLFSVLSFAVAARQREFGIRAAIGASPHALRTVVYSDAARVGGIGLILGVLAATIVAQAIRALVYRVHAWDPLSWGCVIAVLIATMAAACWRPARAAASADPVTLLRAE